jgi:hypothetical protein
MMVDLCAFEAAFATDFNDIVPLEERFQAGTRSGNDVKTARPLTIAMGPR